MTHMINKTLLACALGLVLDAGHAASKPQAPAAAPKAAPAPAPAPDCIDLHQAVGQRLALVRGKSMLKRFCSPATQVTVGAPEVANVVVTSTSEVVIVPRSVGSTNLIVSGRDGHSTVIDLDVGLDIAPLRVQFDTLFPLEKGLRVGSSGAMLVLSGLVSDAAVASQLMAMATAFQQSAAQSVAAAAPAAGSPAPAGVGVPTAIAATPLAGTAQTVLNMLSIAAPQQVMLEVKIAEVSKSLVDQLGANAGYSKTNGTWTYGILSNLLSGTPSLLSGVQSATKGLVIDGQSRDGLVKILAEPSVMAISGQEASFLAGGKIFIPVAQTAVGGANTITLEEKEYGVAVKFTPTVLAGGRINLRVAPEVSELNRDGIGINASGSTATAILPAFTTRRATTTVQLKDGQSFAIGGLIKNNVTTDIKRFPFLGEMPLLGPLFRSSEFQSDRSELVFIVTPHLVKPLADTPALPTDAYIEPNRTEFLLGGQHEGRPVQPAQYVAPKDTP